MRQISISLRKIDSTEDTLGSEQKRLQKRAARKILETDVPLLQGRVYGKMMKQFVEAYEPLNDYLRVYKDPIGQKIYNQSLDMCRQYFPQYIIEMEGMADGSGIPFYKLFLMTLDDTLTLRSPNKGPVGCTSILINQPTGQLLGHTEDALTSTINNFILLSAHVIPSEREKGGIYPAREEKFKAIAYIGHLAGYASGHVSSGMVYSINTIFVSHPLSGKIPREILTRALLSSKPDLEEVLSILTNMGCGTADGFNVNLAFLNEAKDMRETYTIEVVPNPDGPFSLVAVTKFALGHNSLHTNRLLHIKYPEQHADGYNSSVTREKRYEILTKDREIMTVVDLVKVLGNQDDIETYPIFSDRDSAKVSTIMLSIFDLDLEIWTMWTNNPLKTGPLLQLPLCFTDLVSPTKEELTEGNIPDTVLPFILNNNNNTK